MGDTDHDELAPGSSSYILGQKLDKLLGQLESIVDTQTSINLRLDRLEKAQKLMEADVSLCINSLQQLHLLQANPMEAARLQAYMDERWPKHTMSDAAAVTPVDREVQ